ncbi:serum albumin 2 isoform X1 [Esox lucius]|uniref:serum albumin 2 isoform X1 n=1 Tax=Esox lucius TaxID=8010 RepID=UPI000576BEAA|nr:serum albumin 2 isoform X1 [Esox lucius]XP_034148110.1 serum albumin 2 isoform X1 [Esox lucius]
MRRLVVCSLLMLLSVSVHCQTQNAICEIFTKTKEDGFQSLVLVGLAQNLPNSELGDTEPLIKEAVAMAVKCCSDAPSEDCNWDMADLFRSALCSSESLIMKNNLTHCCEKTGAERAECFVDHKSKIPQDLSLTVEVPAADQCGDFYKDTKAFIKRFLFTFSKHNPRMLPHVSMLISKDYREVLTKCCGDAEAQTCLDNKKSAFQHGVRKRVHDLNSICIVHKNYGEGVVKARKTIEYSQKVPQASFQEIVNMVDQVVATYPPCCSGNMAKCIKKRKELGDRICSDESLVSRTVGLAACCKENITQRGACVTKMKPDPKPDDLSEHYDLHADIGEICNNFTKDPYHTLRKLIYEVSARHPESSQQLILRYSQMAEQAFLQCCDKEDHPDCVKTSLADLDLHKNITNDNNEFKLLCAAETATGEDKFERRMFVYYTKLMPQASFDLLHRVSETVHGIVHDCCHNKPGHSDLHCIEEKLTNTLDVMCHNNDPSSINPRITHCCNQSYAMRRPCVLAMEPDTEFTPPELDPKNFSMGPELCNPQKKEAMVSMKKLLYGLVRHKITITEDQMKTITSNYDIMKDKCCAAEDKASCFKEQAPKLISESAELLKV